MILLDAIFIIQFFLESYDDQNGPRNFKPRMTFDIRQDLMLLENQLPLFIIEEIYDKFSKHSLDNRHKSFLDLATFYLRDYLHLEVVETSPGVERRHHTGCKDLMLCNTRLDVSKATSPGVKKETRHLTDLLRSLMLSRAIKRSCSSSSSHLPQITQPNNLQTNQFKHSIKITDSNTQLKSQILTLSTRVLKYSAVKLLKAGVRFEASKDKCLVNITFDKGVLKIPLLEVDHNFERRIRNIMALEQCCYSSEADICGYMKLMDHLIDSAEDVGLLVRKGIIVHRLGDDAAVSNMINHLCEHIGDNYACFGHISRRLNAHYDNRCNHRKATLKLVYFPNVWRGTATVAATILLILTLIQTIGPFKSLLKGLT
ncbi:UPF0481 protein [Salix suchowensis]|nr:UPF0481 protein [Salix suchowensis]